MKEKASTALLDVNVLVALFDPDHIHHDLAHDWFEDHRRYGWATCAQTETGLIRVLCSPRYSAVGHRPEEIANVLRKFLASGHHSFWNDSVSPTDQRLFNLAMVRGHAQLPDVYLLGLAVSMKGCLATFDRSIPLSAVKGAQPGTLQVIAPAD